MAAALERCLELSGDTGWASWNGTLYFPANFAEICCSESFSRRMSTVATFSGA